MPAPSARGPFPQDFGRYRLVEYLGGGGMGGVYLAEDRKLEIRVALKVPHPALVERPRALDRFFREARAAARLDHPGLCWVLDVGQVGDTPYFVMRYIDGTPLSECPPPGPAPRASAMLVRAIALAMASAHRQGVVHRDLKPSNIIITPAGEPVVVDFGIALVLDPQGPRITDPGALMGTLPYISPEQLGGEPQRVGPASDVYSLGVVFYELLTGHLPYKNPILEVVPDPPVRPAAPPPSARRPGIDATVDAICVKAIARNLRERYAGMEELAAALAGYLGLGTTGPAALTTTRTYWGGESGRPAAAEPAARLLRRESIRFAFAGHGEQAPGGGPPPGRLYLDVGNDRRVGVIDHHQVESAFEGSTARLVLSHPELVDGVVPLVAATGGDPETPFTIVLHKQPDLDCIVSAYLAVARLTTGTYPEGAEALVRYIDKVDEGAIGASLFNPASLYAAFQIVVGRLGRRRWQDEHERYAACVDAGLELVDYVVRQRRERGVSLTAVDALGCPGLFRPEDRREVRADAERYHRKLADPATCARQARLRLPGEFGGTLPVEALLVRDVQGVNDPGRCLFFKDWARSDADRAGNGQGFLALCVFQSEGTRQLRRAILSVIPDGGVSLRGLGARLDHAEADRRRAVHGEDDRVVDPATGTRRPPRTGYDNADPWYDGRAHGYTIVDSPRSGTVLSADEIEAIFLEFGGSPSPCPLPSPPSPAPPGAAPASQTG
jgi:tRNA A-37 threonylcarbamoyl transferase component Bud32